MSHNEIECSRTSRGRHCSLALAVLLAVTPARLAGAQSLQLAGSASPPDRARHPVPPSGFVFLPYLRSPFETAFFESLRIQWMGLSTVERGDPVWGASREERAQTAAARGPALRSIHLWLEPESDAEGPSCVVLMASAEGEAPNAVVLARADFCAGEDAPRVLALKVAEWFLAANAAVVPSDQADRRARNSRSGAAFLLDGRLVTRLPAHDLPARLGFALALLGELPWGDGSLAAGVEGGAFLAASTSGAEGTLTMSEDWLVAVARGRFGAGVWSGGGHVRTGVRLLRGTGHAADGREGTYNQMLASLEAGADLSAQVAKHLAVELEAGAQMAPAPLDLRLLGVPVAREGRLTPTGSLGVSYRF